MSEHGSDIGMKKYEQYRCINIMQINSQYMPRMCSTRAAYPSKKVSFTHVGEVPNQETQLYFMLMKIQNTNNAPYI